MNKLKTDQEIFDTVAKHLLTQNERASNNGACMYRAPNGCKCAVGCLIPDELYSPYFEGQNVMGSQIRNLLIGLGYMNFNFLLALQQVHDYDYEEDWAEKLTELAERYHLDTDVFATVGEE